MSGITVITGGSRGIGAATPLALTCGYDVAINYRTRRDCTFQSA